MESRQIKPDKRESQLAEKVKDCIERNINFELVNGWWNFYKAYCSNRYETEGEYAWDLFRQTREMYLNYKLKVKGNKKCCDGDDLK